MNLKNKRGCLACIPAPKVSFVALGFLAAVTFSGAVEDSNCQGAEKLDDEFAGTESLSAWKIRDSVEGGRQTYEVVSIGKPRSGWLTIEPRPSNGWYQDGMGPMLYKDLEGDFLVETRVVTHSRNAPDLPPRASYNSAGLIVRDPASEKGKQNWVVVNVGQQDGFAGSEAKTTVNSRSNLELQRGSHNGRLRLARIGSTVYALRMLDGEGEWKIIREMERSDLPRRVQVGIMCNGWTNRADLVAHFDYARFRVPNSKADLLREAPK